MPNLRAGILGVFQQAVPVALVGVAAFLRQNARNRLIRAKNGDPGPCRDPSLGAREDGERLEVVRVREQVEGAERGAVQRTPRGRPRDATVPISHEAILPPDCAVREVCRFAGRAPGPARGIPVTLCTLSSPRRD